LRAKRTATGAEVRATVKNTSSREGDEVLQFYVSGATGDNAPLLSFRGFQRVDLKAARANRSPSQSLPMCCRNLPRKSVSAAGNPSAAHRV